MFNRKNGGSRGGFGGDRRSSGFKKEGGSRGGFGRREGGDRERPQMHKAICAECGDSCQVPFKPSGERPVLCSLCFGGKESSPRSFSSREESRPERNDRFSDKDQFEALNAKLDKLIRLVEKL